MSEGITGAYGAVAHSHDYFVTAMGSEVELGNEESESEMSLSKLRPDRNILSTVQTPSYLSN